MAEIKTDLIMLRTGELYQAGEDDYVITSEHTHSDILRFVVADIGIDDAILTLEGMREA